MKNALIFLVVLMASACSFSTKEQVPETLVQQDYQLDTLWTIEEGLVHPESVIYDESRQVYYVSNIGEDESAESPDGFISRLNADGTVRDLKFVTGIRSPKGLCLANGKLYVSALSELLEMDAETGQILQRYTHEKVAFLNDVTSDTAGNVYVSGMRENIIYKLTPHGDFTPWYHSISLEHPNGVYCLQDKMYIGGWGSMGESDWVKDSVSYLFELDCVTKKLKKVSTNRIGKVDGIQAYNQGLLISSWKAGELFVITNQDEIKPFLLSETSVGDIYFNDKSGLLILPLNFQHKLQALRVQ